MTGPTQTTRKRPVPLVGALLARLRIRKKLILLHTVFSLVLAGALWLALRPAVREVVKAAELHESEVVMSILRAERQRELSPGGGIPAGDGAIRSLRERLGAGVELKSGTPEELGLTPLQAAEARSGGVSGVSQDGRTFVVRFEPENADGRSAGRGGGRYLWVSVVLDGARAEVFRLYVLLLVALLGVYVLVAAALELFVLPQHVYGPIRTMLAADAAVQEGRREDELISASEMPADELGEIMRSRNDSIQALRRHEAELGDALGRLEAVAGDLKRKNELLQMAQRNLADADRLASLGVMSAGIAHELNTPLAVLKGLVEKQHAGRGARREGGAEDSALTFEESALMLRVVGRLERLSESLLDFARVRPPESRPALIRPLIDEAWTLVKIDRSGGTGGGAGSGGVECVNGVPEAFMVVCDVDRMVQVFVNVLRNAVDAMDASPARSERRILVTAENSDREGQRLAIVTIADTGPGISPDMLGRLFQPFASTRLDAKGTGLGLAVADGIVREHGGMMVARNRTEVRGAVFEITLPG